jgi:hypothetical protein
MRRRDTADLKLRSAVDASSRSGRPAQACAVEPSLVDGIGNARAIIGFRNQLIHGYALVDDEIVWGNIERLPSLIADVEGELLARS